MAHLHRGPDGFITYAAKRAGEWRTLGAAPVGQPWIPGLDTLLETDGFVSINSSFTTAWRTTRHRWVPIPGLPGGEQVVGRKTQQVVDPLTGLFYAKHDTKSLRWLNAAYVDLDCYAVGQDVEGTIAEVLRRQESGTIPPATAFGLSVNMD